MLPYAYATRFYIHEFWVLPVDSYVFSNGSRKRKVVIVLVMKADRESRGIAPLIFDVATRCAYFPK